MLPRLFLSGAFFALICALATFQRAFKAQAWLTPSEVSGWSLSNMPPMLIFACASFHLDSPWRIRKKVRNCGTGEVMNARLNITEKFGFFPWVAP